MPKHLSDDALLDAAERAGTEVPEHLLSCVECRSKVEELRGAFEAVRSAGAPEPPPEYWTAFRRQVAARVREEEPRRAFRLWVPALALAAGALVLALALPRGAREAPPRNLPAWSAIPADEETVMTAVQGLQPSREDVAAVIGTSTVAEEVANLSDEERVELSRALRAEMKGGAL